MISGLLLLVIVVVLVAVAVSRRRRPEDVVGRAPEPARRPSTLARRAPHAATPTAFERLLDEWRDAGLLDAGQVAPILAYEEAKHGPRSRVPIAAEAVGYVGAALVFGAFAMLVGNNFEDFSRPVRVVLLGVPAILAALIGWFTGRDPDPAFERLGSVLWVLAAVLLAGTMTEVWVDLVHDGDPPAHGGVLFVAGGAFTWAVVAYVLRRLPLQHLVLFAATVASVLGVVDATAAGRASGWSSVVWGSALWAVGAVWATGGCTRRLTPPVLATLLGGAALLVGAQIIRVDNTVLGLWLGLATAAVLLGVGVARADAVVLLAGAAGLFQWSPQLAMYYLEPAIGTEATLFVVGVVLIVAALGSTRLYRRMRAEHTPSEG